MRHTRDKAGEISTKRARVANLYDLVILFMRIVTFFLFFGEGVYHFVFFSLFSSRFLFSVVVCFVRDNQNAYCFRFQPQEMHAPDVVVLKMAIVYSFNTLLIHACRCLQPSYLFELTCKRKSENILRLIIKTHTRYA